MTNRHVPCIRCEYDLFGIEESDRCPECGTLVHRSIDPSRLFFANPQFLRALLWCLVLWFIWGIEPLLFFFLGFLFGIYSNHFGHAMFLVLFVNFIGLTLVPAAISLLCLRLSTLRTGLALCLTVLLGVIATTFSEVFGFVLSIEPNPTLNVPAVWKQVMMFLPVASCFLLLAGVCWRIPKRSSMWLLIAAFWATMPSRLFRDLHNSLIGYDFYAHLPVYISFLPGSPPLSLIPPVALVLCWMHIRGLLRQQAVADTTRFAGR